jgi:hypothetical protein
MNRRVILALLVFSLTSCATAKLTPDKKASIRSIHVSVEFLREPFVYGPEGNALSITSGRVAGDAPEGAAAEYEQILSRHLDMRKLIEEQARRELVRKGYQVVETPAQADAKLRFMVVYGLGIASAFNSTRGRRLRSNQAACPTRNLAPGGSFICAKIITVRSMNPRLLSSCHNSSPSRDRSPMPANTATPFIPSMALWMNSVSTTVLPTPAPPNTATRPP